MCKSKSGLSISETRFTPFLLKISISICESKIWRFDRFAYLRFTPSLSYFTSPYMPSSLWVYRLSYILSAREIETQVVKWPAEAGKDKTRLRGGEDQSKVLPTEMLKMPFAHLGTFEKKKMFGAERRRNTIFNPSLISLFFLFVKITYVKICFALPIVVNVG